MQPLPRHTETKKSLLFKYNSGVWGFFFTICSLLKSQESNAIWIKRFFLPPECHTGFCYLQALLTVSLFVPHFTYCVPIASPAAAMHSQHQESWPPSLGEELRLLQTPIHAACSTNPGKPFCAQKRFAPHSVSGTFSLSPVARSYGEMSTWSPLEASRSCFWGLKTSQDLAVWA